MRAMFLSVEPRHAITAGSDRRNSRGGVRQLQSAGALRLFRDGGVKVRSSACI